MNVGVGQGLLVRSLLLIVAALGLFGGGVVEAPRAVLAASADSGSVQVGPPLPAAPRADVPAPRLLLRAAFVAPPAQTAAGAALPPSTGLVLASPSSFAPPVPWWTALLRQPHGVALGRAPPVMSGT